MSYIRRHMAITQKNKCTMCGKDIIGYNKENEQKQRQENNNSSLSSSTVVIAAEQINGSYYTFDTASCALMFEKFNAVYGSSLAHDD
jgi:hypothetical protein